MVPLLSWLARRPIRAYIVLAFGISYLVGMPAQWALGAWAPWLPDMAALYLGRAPVVFGPAIAALLVTSAAEGRDGRRRLLAGLRPSARHGPWWVALPLVSLAATVAAYLLSGTTVGELTRALPQGWPVLLLHYVLQVAIVGVGEEVGWRGWLLPRMLAGRSRAGATVLVASVWGVWHLPILLSGVGMALSFAMAVLALSVLFTALWERTGRSVFLVAVAHGSVNAPLFFFEGALGGEAWRAAWYLVCAMYAGAAVLLAAARWRWWMSRKVPGAFTHEEVHADNVLHSAAPGP